MLYVIKHVPEEGAGIFECFFTEKPITIMASSLDFPEPKKDDMFIIMGGPMGVYEKNEYPFIKKELDFIKKCADKNSKILGICLGAQMIAESLGGKVYKGHTKEVGWYNIEHTEYAKNDEIFNLFPQSMYVFQWHQDTFDLPKEAIRLAKNHNYENQAFKIGRNIYGLQYHIEVTDEILKDWFPEEKTNNHYIDKDKMIEAQKFAEEFFRKFISL